MTQTCVQTRQTTRACWTLADRTTPNIIGVQQLFRLRQSIIFHHFHNLRLECIATQIDLASLHITENLLGQLTLQKRG